MQSLQQLFVHELQDAWAAETRLLSALDRLSREQTTPQAQSAFSRHLTETRTHVQRLQHIFDALGVQPGTQRCEGLDGIVHEHDAFLQYQPDPETHAVFDVGAAERVEHYEIATYGSLVRLADALGMDRIEETLQSTLNDEWAQLNRLRSVAETTNLERLAEEGARRQALQPQQPIQGQGTPGGQSMQSAQR